MGALSSSCIYGSKATIPPFWGYEAISQIPWLWGSCKTLSSCPSTLGSSVFIVGEIPLSPLPLPERPKACRLGFPLSLKYRPSQAITWLLQNRPPTGSPWASCVRLNSVSSFSNQSSCFRENPNSEAWAALRPIIGQSKVEGA